MLVQAVGYCRIDNFLSEPSNGLIKNLAVTIRNLKITILARRPRGLRAKINLASKEMSVFVVRLKNITWEINGGTNLCFSKPLTRVFQVEIYSLQKTFLIRLLFHILRIKFCIYFKPDAKP